RGSRQGLPMACRERHRWGERPVPGHLPGTMGLRFKVSSRCVEASDGVGRGPHGATPACHPFADEGALVPPVITAEGLYKVFGRRPARGVEALQQGRTRDELREDGLTAAVIDASFSVDPGEIFVVMGLSG